MDVKEAVKIAKNWVADVLKDEGIFNIGLEEVNFDDQRNAWLITVGFSRPWNSLKHPFTAISGEPASKRAYRVISVTEPNGTVTSMMRKGSED